MLSNKGAERAVLSGLCKHGFDCYVDVVDLLTIDCFIDPKNQNLYKVIESIFAKDQKSIDIPSINSEAHSLGLYERICKDQIDQEYIRSLFNYPIEETNVRNQVEILVKLKIGRKAQESHQKAFQKLEEIKGNEGIDEIVKISEAPFMELMSTMTNENSVNRIGEDIDEYLEYLENNDNKSVGVYSPFPIFNDIVGDGLRPGVHLIAARAKALRYGSKVYTPNGPRNIEDINVGDIVIHPFKGETKVLQTHDHNNKNLFRIFFRDGDFVDCCEDHLWEVKKRWGKKTLIMSTKEIIDHGFYKKGKCVFDIRLPNPTNFIEKEVEVKPYTLGVLLGDGSFCNKRTVVFASMDDEIVNFIKGEYGDKLKFDYKDKNKKCTSYRINSLKKIIEKMGLWGKKSTEKWIPDNYKYNSIEVRLEILRGLMDTDGCCVFDKKSGNSRCQFSSSSLRLVEDVKEIVESLGGLCSLIKTNTKLNNKIFTSYKCEIRLPLFNPFKLLRKANNVRPRILGELKRSIRDIKPIGIDNARCLTLEENDGLFMTNNFIVTHNTGKMQPYDSLIYTPTGPKKMGDIETGDVVLTPFNEIAFVTDIFEHGQQDVYKVGFIDGTSMECGLDHIFEYTTRKGSYFRNKTLREMLKYPIQGPDRHYLYRIRISKPIEFKETQQVIDPYTMGVILSDETAFKVFKNKDMLLFYDIEKWEDRHIPEEYLYGTLKSRQQLFKGLMDGSGIISKTIKEYRSDSKILCQNISELARTMGAYVENYDYRVLIRFDKNTKSLVSVEKLEGQKESRCIKINKSHGLYLTDNIIVTHNSTVGKEVSVYAAQQGVPTLYLDTEMQSSDQINRILASTTKINIRRIEKGLYKENPHELKLIRQAGSMLKSLPLCHKNVSGKDFSYVLSILKRWIHKEVGFNGDKPNPHLVIYDYFKLMNQASLKDAQEYQLMGFQIAAMHDFCMQYNTPVLSFVQTNRDGITKDTADVISQSDRLVWNAISISILRRKSSDEIAVDGPQNGNAKLIPLAGRYMKMMNDGDYINFNINGDIAHIKEISTRNNPKTDTGFDIDNSSEQEVESRNGSNTSKTRN
jgi:replicative DNA helicase